jgi:hypothetical protein
MLKSIWILSMTNKTEVVDCYDENDKKIPELSGKWKDCIDEIFKLITKETVIHDCRNRGILALELAIWLKEGGK